MVELLRSLICGPTGLKPLTRSPFRTPGKPNHATSRPAILCKIARFWGGEDGLKLVKSKPALLETSIPSLSFRSLS